MTHDRNVLVVEDEAEIRNLIQLHLTREGCSVESVSNGDDAVALFQEKDFDLIVLDWMLPGVNGIELTRWIRRSLRPLTPILFVTAKTDPEMIVLALDSGADDYITKPFDTMIFAARANALLRRYEWLKRHNHDDTGIITAGAITLNASSYDVQLAGQKLELTRSEFRLLEALMLNQGKVLSRESLIHRVQGEGVSVVGRTVDTHIFGLRKKLGDHGHLVETIRGIGYRVRNDAP